MWPIFTRALKDRRTLLLIYCLAGIGLLWMYIALFPSFSDQQQNLEQLIKAYPESFLKAFNFDIKSFTTIEGFLSTEQFSFMWPILLIFILIGFAGGALAGEVEKGTIETLLSQPVSRAELFFSRYLAGVVMLILFVVFSIFAAIPIIEIYNISYKFENFFAVAYLGLLFGWAILSLGFLFSAIFSDKGKVSFITGGILVVMYVLNIIAALKDNLADLKYASFFYYFNASKALIYNEIDQWSYVVFIGVAVVCTIVGAIWFSKRNIAA